MRKYLKMYIFGFTKVKIYIINMKTIYLEASFAKDSGHCGQKD